MAAFKPAYLIHGDDHGRIGERRTRLRRLAEAQSGANGVEIFEGDASTPEQIAQALNAMTFALGRRFIIAEGVELWKDKELEPLEAADHLVLKALDLGEPARDRGGFLAEAVAERAPHCVRKDDLELVGGLGERLDLQARAVERCGDLGRE